MGKRFSLFGERGKGTAIVDGLIEHLNKRASDLEGGSSLGQEQDLMGVVVGASGTVDAIRVGGNGNGNLLLTSFGDIFISINGNLTKVEGKHGMKDFVEVQV